MAESFLAGYQGLIAAGVLPEDNWPRIAAGVSATLADAAKTGRVLPPSFQPLVGELVRRSLVRPTELVDVRFGLTTTSPGPTRES